MVISEKDGKENNKEIMVSLIKVDMIWEIDNCLDIDDVVIFWK